MNLRNFERTGLEDLWLLNHTSRSLLDFNPKDEETEHVRQYTSSKYSQVSMSSAKTVDTTDQVPAKVTENFTTDRKLIFLLSIVSG
jgi:hypothetical protein